jgi:predicted TPR repeat methyltransferase
MIRAATLSIRPIHGFPNQAYDGWARGYDADMDRRGYKLPGLVTALVARHIPIGQGPILDAGAGTGLLGEWLDLAGYTDLAALDLSQGMLDIAASRGVYDTLTCAPLGDQLDYPENHFRAVASAGSFGVHHAPAAAFESLIDITQPGGHLILTVRYIDMEKGGFPQEIARLENGGRWKTLESLGPFFAFRDEPDSAYIAWVFEKAP